MSSTIKSYFEHKKRDLSDKSNNNKEVKKATESSLDLLLSKETNDDADVFTEGIRNRVSIFKIVQNFESKINDIYELSFPTKDAQIKGARQLEEVSKSIKGTLMQI